MQGPKRSCYSSAHVPGSCTPGNEAADQLAKSAARDDGEAKDPMRALVRTTNLVRNQKGETVLVYTPLRMMQGH